MLIKNQQELIFKIQKENCNKSYIELLNQYKPLIKNLSITFNRKYKSTPIELEDLENVISYYFYELAKNYDSKSKKTFPSYIKDFLFYKTSTWLRGYISNNNQVMNYYSQTMEDEQYVSEYIYSTQNNVNEIKISEMDYLTTIEKIVIKYSTNGYTIKQISNELKINLKTLYAARKRAIYKIQKENIET